MGAAGNFRRPSRDTETTAHALDRPLSALEQTMIMVERPLSVDNLRRRPLQLQDFVIGCLQNTLLRASLRNACR